MMQFEAVVEDGVIKVPEEYLVCCGRSVIVSFPSDPDELERPFRGRPGALKGQLLWLSDDFDAVSDDIGEYA